MIKILKSKPEDLPEILQLQYAAYQSEAELNNDFTIQPLTQTPDELVAEHQKGVILKAVLNEKTIGSVRAYADGDTVYIGKLMVHPDHRGKGLGKRLLAEIEGQLSRKRFELFTSLQSVNNLRLYEKTGYKQFKEQTNESGMTFVYLEKKAEDGTALTMGISFGMIAGIVIGILTDDIALWLPIGLCIGVAFGSVFPFKR